MQAVNDVDSVSDCTQLLTGRYSTLIRQDSAVYARNTASAEAVYQRASSDTETSSHRANEAETNRRESSAGWDVTAAASLADARLAALDSDAASADGDMMLTASETDNQPQRSEREVIINENQVSCPVLNFGFITYLLTSCAANHQGLYNQYAVVLVPRPG